MKEPFFIGVAAHKTAYFPDIPFHYPVCAGAYKNKIGPEGIVGGAERLFCDNTGDNISEKNGSYNELTVQYWMWKNVDAEYIGLCHYRRYFNFGKDVGKQPRLGETFPWKRKLAKKYGWDAKQIEAAIRSADMLLARDTARCRPHSNIQEHFAEWGGEESPFVLIGQCIDVLYPEYKPYYERMCKESKISSFNMFIMKRELFAQYSEWLFKIEGLLEEKLAARAGNHFGRAFGEMGEYLLNIWAWYQIDKRHVTCKKLQTSMFYETALNPTGKQSLKALLNELATIIMPYGGTLRYYVLFKWFFKNAS